MSETNIKKRIPIQSNPESTRNEIEQSASDTSSSQNIHQAFLHKQNRRIHENVNASPRIKNTNVQKECNNLEARKFAHSKIKINNENAGTTKTASNKDGNHLNLETKHNDLPAKSSKGSNDNPKSSLKIGGLSYSKKLEVAKPTNKNILSFFHASDDEESFSAVVKSNAPNSDKYNSVISSQSSIETSERNMVCCNFTADSSIKKESESRLEKKTKKNISKDDDDPELSFSDEDDHTTFDNVKFSMNDRRVPALFGNKKNSIHFSEKPFNTSFTSSKLELQNSDKTEEIFDYQFKLPSDDYIDKISEPKLLVHSKYGIFKVRWPHINASSFSSGVINRLHISVKLPKSIQTAIWPAVMRGHSVLTVGPSNCGKTIGIVSGLCSLVSDFDLFDSLPSTNGPLALIICTSNQAVGRLQDLCNHLLLNSEINGRKVKVMKIVNTLSDFQNLTFMNSGCDILITTPYILDLANYKKSKLDLTRLVYFYVENIDKFDQGICKDVWKIYTICQSAVKTRINKEIELTTFGESRMWCGLMKNFANMACNPVVCISALQECILYSELNLNIHFTLQKDKIKYLSRELANKKWLSDRTVIVCNEDSEVTLIVEYLKSKQMCIIKGNSKMNLEENMHIHSEYKSLCGQKKNVILVCTDSNLVNSDIRESYNLIHFSLPDLFSTFYHRFACLIDTLPNMWNKLKSNLPAINVSIYIDENNQKQLPKLINFANRCGYSFDDQIKQKIDALLNIEEKVKSASLIPLCNELMTHGICYNFTDCKQRHGIFSKTDALRDWIPTDGFVKFKLLHIHSAAHYSIRIIEHLSVDCKITKFVSNHVELFLKMSKYYLNFENRRPLSNPKSGDICGIEYKSNSFYRCQIIDVSFKNKGKLISSVLVNLIDKEEFINCDCKQLYELPDVFKTITTNVLQVRLIGIIPTHLCVPLNDISKNELVHVANDENCFMRGKIVLGINNCLWLDSVNCYQNLKSCNRTVMKLNIAKYLLDGKFAKEQKDHLKMLTNLCQKYSFFIPQYNKKEIKVLSNKKSVLPRPQWAHLELENINEIYICNVISPGVFFVKLIKFDDLVTSLSVDLEKYVKNNQTNTKFDIGDYCAAKYNGTLNRVRIESVESKSSYKCFCVDFGDWIVVDSSDVFPIDSQFILRLPFQAIECRLLAIKSSNENWDNESGYLLQEMAFESNDSDFWKRIIALPYITENALHTDGKRYAVACFDSSALLSEKFVLEKFAIYQESEKQFIEIATSKFELFLSNENKINNEDFNEEIIDDHNFEDTDDSSIKNTVKALKNTCEELNISDFDVPNDDFDDSSIKNTVKALKNTREELNISDFDVTNDDFDDGEWDCTLTLDEIIALRKELQPNESEKPSASSNNKSVSLIEIPNDFSDSNIDVIFESSMKNKLNKSDRTTDEKIVKDMIDSKIIKQFEPSSNKCPQIKWREDHETVYIKVDLVGVEEYTLDIKTSSLYFYTDLRGDIYEFNLNLSGGVKKERSTHLARGQYVYIKLAKLVKKRKWEELESGYQRKTIKYDHDHFSSSDEDEKDKEDRFKKIEKDEKRKIIYNALYDNPSDDEEVDDLFDDVYDDE